ncbi:tyrosine-type recombinase/integrase [Actinopolymorpha rutila]|uniref:tyrosine-type recombinase/integrase n=1 Tax=Actinopolymorpha rutila TaxID=446787 RepID=UPI00307FB567
MGWRRAAASVGAPTLRIHDLRHTAASIWLAQGADPKVVQRVLGHATNHGHGASDLLSGAVPVVSVGQRLTHRCAGPRQGLRPSPSVATTALPPAAAWCPDN